VKATEVTAGLVESNGSLLPGLWRDSLHVTCGLTACTPGSAPGPTLGNEYAKTLPFTFNFLTRMLYKNAYFPGGRTGISCDYQRSVIEYGLHLPFYPVSQHQRMRIEPGQQTTSTKLVKIERVDCSSGDMFSDAQTNRHAHHKYSWLPQFSSWFLFF